MYEDGALVANWRVSDSAGVFTTTLRVESIDCNGILSGSLEQCFDGNCGIATLSGAKVEPLDEPESEGISLITEYGGPDNGAWREDGRITYNVRAHSDLAYLARGDGLRIVDISAPEAPRERGFLALSRDGELYNDIKLLDGPNNTLYAITASILRGAVVIDVTDPENPVKIAHYHTWPGLASGYGLIFFEGAIGVDYNPATRTIYVADTHRGLLVLRLDVDAR